MLLSLNLILLSHLLTFKQLPKSKMEEHPTWCTITIVLNLSWNRVLQHTQRKAAENLLPHPGVFLQQSPNQTRCENDLLHILSLIAGLAQYIRGKYRDLPSQDAVFLLMNSSVHISAGFCIKKRHPVMCLNYETTTQKVDVTVNIRGCRTLSATSAVPRSQPWSDHRKPFRFSSGLRPHHSLSHNVDLSSPCPQLKVISSNAQQPWLLSLKTAVLPNG